MDPKISWKRGIVLYMWFCRSRNRVFGLRKEVYNFGENGFFLRDRGGFGEEGLTVLYTIGLSAGRDGGHG